MKPLSCRAPQERHIAGETSYTEFEYLSADRYEMGYGYFTYRSRGTPDWLLIYTLEGGGRFRVGGVQFDVKSHDIALLSPGTVHDYMTTADPGLWHILWVHFHPRPHWTDWLEWDQVADGLAILQVSDAAARARIIQKMSAMILEQRSGIAYHTLLAMSKLEEVLIDCAASASDSTAMVLDERIQRVIDHLHEHIAADVSLADLSRVAGISASHLRALFGRALGRTPQEYHEGLRLSVAKHQLQTTRLSIKHISENVGYQNPFYFSARFKRSVGMSPARFRSRLPSARTDLGDLGRPSNA